MVYRFKINIQERDVEAVIYLSFTIPSHYLLVTKKQIKLERHINGQRTLLHQ